MGAMDGDAIMGGDDSPHFYSIELRVMPDTEAEAVKVGEILARAAAGLMLDGLSVEVRYMRVERSDDD